MLLVTQVKAETADPDEETLFRQMPLFERVHYTFTLNMDHFRNFWNNPDLTRHDMNNIWSPENLPKNIIYSCLKEEISIKMELCKCMYSRQS